MSAREAILGRLRRAARGGQEGLPDRQAALAAHLQARACGPLPQWEGSVTERFMQAARALGTSCELLADAGAVPQAVARYLAALGEAPAGVMTGELSHFDWLSAGLTMETRPARADDRVGLTGCFCAIAETGTLMLASGAQTPASVSLLPETHIALLPVARIGPWMETAWDWWRQAEVGLPRAVNFVSGPSRTGDIEQTLVIGAHGPCRVHVVLYPAA